MRAYVAVTDPDWYQFLSEIHDLAEVNFWRPSDKRRFSAIDPGELFLFKLRGSNYIVGGGVFARWVFVPISLAWESFQELNGAGTYAEMRNRVGKLRRTEIDNITDYSIGCILVEQPFFIARNKWIAVPSDWEGNIVQGRTYDLSTGTGFSLWLKLQSAMTEASNIQLVKEESPLYGTPIVITPRLGQGSFRILVTDAYDRKCSITNERTLPALDAAHIKPVSEMGQHEVKNGILMRRDLHALFDKGYMTINPTMKLEVSRRIREEFENGRDYYKLDGTSVRLPYNPLNHPSIEYLRWHNEKIYRG